MKQFFASLLLLTPWLMAAQTNHAHDSLWVLMDEWRQYSRRNTGPGEDSDSVVLPGISVAKEQAKAVYATKLLQRLSSIPDDKLNTDDQINKDLMQYILEDLVSQVAFETYLVPLSADGGFHINFQYLVNAHPFQQPGDYSDYLAKMQDFPRYTAQNLDLLRMGLKKGNTVPKGILGGILNTVQPHTEGDVTESFFYRPFKNFPASFADSTKTRLAAEGSKAMEQYIRPAFVSFYKFLQDEYIPGARNSLGATQLPDGKAFYEQRIRYFTTLNMTPDEVYATGEKEVARIRAEMEAIIKKLNFQGSFADFLQFLRTDPQFYAATPRALLAEASYWSKKIDGLLPKYFGKLPRLPYGVQPVPDAIAPNYTGGRYVPGSPEQHRSGTYWVNTYDLKSRPLYVLPSLTLHEAVPGHHLQGALAQELEDVHPMRRSVYLSAYGEGWALYCEWLGKEAGIYEDLYQEFGRLTYEMWRACRLVVDVGIHAKGWSRDQAIAFLAGNTALSLHEVTTEIDRYIGWPGQAVSYKIGELTIRRLRAEAEQALGAQFNIREFHDLILSRGAVPLSTLEKMVQQYVQGKVKP